MAICKQCKSQFSGPGPLCGKCEQVILIATRDAVTFQSTESIKAKRRTMLPYWLIALGCLYLTLCMLVPFADIIDVFVFSLIVWLFALAIAFDAGGYFPPTEDEVPPGRFGRNYPIVAEALGFVTIGILLFIAHWYLRDYTVFMIFADRM